MAISRDKLVLRPYTPEDIPIVLSKHVTIYREEFNFPPEEFRTMVSKALDDLVRSERSMMWIAEHPLNPSTDPSTSDDEGGVIWAGSIAAIPTAMGNAQIRVMLTAPEFRSCGLGWMLLERALEYCRGEGLARIGLSTTSECRAARRLYQRYGFEIADVSENMFWGITVEWWEKQLDESNE
jgi:ribosomal protein S18 acetylase RimI-like enzyme